MAQSLGQPCGFYLLDEGRAPIPPHPAVLYGVNPYADSTWQCRMTAPPSSSLTTAGNPAVLELLLGDQSPPPLLGPARKRPDETRAVRSFRVAPLVFSARGPCGRAQTTVRYDANEIYGGASELTAPLVAKYGSRPGRTATTSVARSTCRRVG